MKKHLTLILRIYFCCIFFLICQLNFFLLFQDKFLHKCIDRDYILFRFKFFYSNKWVANQHRRILKKKKKKN